MLNFVKRAFRGLMEVVLWLNLAVCVIAGAIIGRGAMEYPWQGGGLIFGLVLGALAGLVLNIVLGGFIATFLEIGEDVAQMKRNLDRLENANSGNAGNTWSCKKCGTVNALTATACKDCGAYK